MKINTSRQNIYLLFLSVSLFLFVLVFSFSLLIPQGKDYRNMRAELKKENSAFRNYNNFRSEVSQRLMELKADNRHIIQALDTEFNPSRFEKINQDYFNSLSISPKLELDNENDFSVYEVKTTSKINSPKSFYDFLDAVNKSDWIISINFPINFKREAEMISSSFTMKVYGVAKENNTTKLVVSQ